MATFRLNPAPTFDATVHLTVPGASDPAALELTFRHQGRKALEAWAKRAAGGGDAKPVEDAEFLAEVIAGWRGVKDDQDRDLPFSAAALWQLLDAYPAAGGEIFGAYIRALTESRAKN